MVRALFWGIVLAIPAAFHADSITVGGDTHRNVYIGSDAHNYYIHYPEEGRMERVSKRRTDVRNVEIDSDRDRRTALLDTYKANKNKPEAPAPEPRSATPVTENATISSEAFKERERHRAAALFDAQFMFWKSLAAEQRAGIAQTLAALAEESHRSYSQTIGALEGNISALEEKRSGHAKNLEELELHRNVAAGLSGIGDYSDFYREKSREYHSGPQTDLSRRMGAAYDEAARLEAEQAQNRRATIHNEFNRKASPHLKALGAIDSSIAAQKRQGIAVEQSARENARRLGGYQALAAQLDAAIEQGYSPQTKPLVIREERGDTSKRTAPFEINAPIWRLECTRKELFHPGEFSVTVYNAETDVPFTRIPGADMLQMRIQMLDGPGEFYLEITADDSNVPYEVIVTEFPE